MLELWHMSAASIKRKADLEKKFQRVATTPASFELFLAIHDFVDHVEANAFLVSGLSSKIKANRELDISSKYAHLKKIYQGLEDIAVKSKNDLGHTRYMTMQELGKIKEADVSESNSFWRKRELFRRLTSTVYERLAVYLSE
jgi:hypothetical protein